MKTIVCIIVMKKKKGSVLDVGVVDSCYVAPNC